MVHIKRVELSNFKSFGGTTEIPLLPGFTVVSGPNGSGKSNILDALLFCLGLASSKGMRAERLPDLVNHKQTQNNRTVETSVSVTFDLSDLEDLADLPLENNLESPQENQEESNDNFNPIQFKEWTVTRRLRVTKGGSYSSNYYINGQPCNVTELHEQLNRLRVYPEGYNVVLQGDVTRIITMNAKERREIIDELAGVAAFDRKIEQTKITLESVREREEKCQIIQQELQKNLERLAADRIKAEKYQKLRAKVHEKQVLELVLIWRSLQQQESQILGKIDQGNQEIKQINYRLETLERDIKQAVFELDNLNRQVKALGEDEQLSVSSTLATQKAKQHQLQQRQQELEITIQQHNLGIERLKTNLQEYQQTIVKLNQDQAILERETLPFLKQQYQQTKDILDNLREEVNTIAAASEAWVQEQTAITHRISNLQKSLNPQRTEQAQLRERNHQLEQKISENSQQLTTIEQEIITKQSELANLAIQVQNSQQQIQSLTEQLKEVEQDYNIQQETQTRLLKEQREKQRQLDQLEAKKEAEQEAQGTYATKIILNSNIAGVCGLVAQLGQVETEYQLALEIAAGSRLGYLVVENDQVAAMGIELLKQKRAGRATFLPLNKINAPRLQDPNLRGSVGYIDLAINLINFEPKYERVFAYIFGNTVVFETLNDARSHLGKYRIVTLDGELLETSGAMTGGSVSSRSSLHFGKAIAGESEEIKLLRNRLAEIEKIVSYNEQSIAQKASIVKQSTQQLTELKTLDQKHHLHLEQTQRDIERLTQQKDKLQQQLLQQQQELEQAKSSLHHLETNIPILEAELHQEQQRLQQLEASQTHSEWLEVQKLIKAQEEKFNEREQTLRQAENQIKDISNHRLRLEEKIAESQQHLEQDYQKQSDLNNQQSEGVNQLQNLAVKIQETEVLLQQLIERLGSVKTERDRAETVLRELQNQQQQNNWQLQKLHETQQEREETLQQLQEQIKQQEGELPDSLPEIPEEMGDNYTLQLEELQKEIRNGQKRLEAMEPVNMLALEEYENTQNRLQELSEKLQTLEAERTELLLRAEKFTTLRLRAFKEAFDAVNENFKTIFATLSEGDGYLELESEEDPFSGGLNLIAHPKGKPVQRLSSMSGGEKSLTALSFIFSLQRYRPSPFYAFDEVDMFLDGANVERLSQMIKQQAQQAQFIVVSLRRPMIEASERTIGVTQARGAYTQVLGIKI